MPPTSRSRAAAVLAVGLTLASCTPRDLPEHLAGATQSFVARGDAGLLRVRKLHGRELDVQSGAFASYGGAASMWVAEARDTVVAEQLMADMLRQISGGMSPFHVDSTTTIDDRRVSVLSGLNQRHYCFRVGRRVVWIAAIRDEAPSALGDALAFYR